jgi:Kef-type K+ transport system membrane component KefB
MKIFLFIALILLSTKTFSLFMRRMHMPQVLGALAAGVILGPALLNIIQPNDTLAVFAEFGVVLLLFAAGMETDFKQLRNAFKASLLISVLGIVLSLGGGFAIALLFGKPSLESFFIGVVIASMSTSITVEALQEMGKLRTKAGTAILGASLFDDIIVIVLLAVLMGMGESNGISFNAISGTLVRIVLFFVFAIASGWCVNKLFNFLYNKVGATRRISIFAIAYCFVMAYLAELFGLADITGAYIAGIAFCNTRCVETVDTDTHSLSFLFFTPIFLANIGINTTFDGMDGSMVLFTIALVVIAVAGKFIGCGLAARICGFTRNESLQVGVGMIARGEVSFIVASKGILAGYMNPNLFPGIIIVVLATVLITPLLMNVVFKPV